MSTDLRAKIAVIIDDIIGSLDPRWASASIVADDVNERTDEVLALVAEWLRAEADELRRPLPGRQPEGDSYRHIEANALDLRAKRLADSLTTQPSTEEEAPWAR